MKTAMMTLCFSLLLLSISSVKAQPRSFLCDGANYTMKSPFQSNLNSLLASLSSTNATFFTDAKGQAPNRAYGLILCRGDLSPSDCSACFSDAARHVSSMDRREPGPHDPSVLYDQGRHRTSSPPVPQNQLGEIIDRSKSWNEWIPTDARFIAGLEMAGFRSVLELRWIRVDRSLIWALVDRWRPETNTFHLPVGEMTVTLQDVAIILGLPLGKRFFERDDKKVEALPLMEAYLGRVHDPESTASDIPLGWLKDQFEVIPEDATALQIECHVRAFLLWTIGKFLMPNASKNKVGVHWLRYIANLPECSNLNWCAAVLAHMYEELTKAALNKNKQIHMCTLLLQVWSWSRLHLGVPLLPEEHGLGPLEPFGCLFLQKRMAESPQRSVRFYRNELDVLEESQVTWEPYEAIIEELPPICRQNQHLWRARVPLFCGKLVYMHYPDRVMRQFGLAQHIPDPTIRVPDWTLMNPSQRRQALVSFEAMAQMPHNYIIDERLPRIEVRQYMEWYVRITRRWVLVSAPLPVSYQPRGPIERDFSATLENVVRDATVGLRSRAVPAPTRSILTRILENARSALCRHRQPPTDEVIVPVRKKRTTRTAGQGRGHPWGHGDEGAGPSRQHEAGPDDQEEAGPSHQEETGPVIEEETGPVVEEETQTSHQEQQRYQLRTRSTRRN